MIKACCAHTHACTQNMTELFPGPPSSQPFSLDSKSLSPRQVIWNRGRNRWGVEVIQASLAPSCTFGSRTLCGSRTLWSTWLARWLALACRRFWLFKVMAIWQAFTPCPVLWQIDIIDKKIKNEHARLFTRHRQQMLVNLVSESDVSERSNMKPTCSIFFLERLECWNCSVELLWFQTGFVWFWIVFWIFYCKALATLMRACPVELIFHWSSNTFHQPSSQGNLQASL